MSPLAQLVWINRAEGEVVFHVRDGSTIGRGDDNDVVLDEEGVSRKHVALAVRGGTIGVRDLGSTNGTFLNGTRVQDATMRPGDTLLVGRAALRLRGEGGSGERADTLALGSTTIEVALEAARAEYPRSGASIARAEDHLRLLCRILESINAGNTSNAEGSSDDLYRMALEGIVDTLAVDYGAILLGTDPSRPPAFEVHADRAAGRAPRRRVPSRTLAGRVLARGEALLANDPAADDALAGARSLAGERGARLLCAPIAASDRIHGALYLAADAGRPPLGESELRLATVVGRSLALAADNLRRRELLIAENRVLRALPGEDLEIAGTSPEIRRVKEQIRRAATTDATLLITGETGTGKELVARAVHALGRRRDGPFIAVNCGALPATTIESELFGHEKGAFTGATERRIGKFELAHKGTLFLDEVGELPLELQVKLLRVLEEPRFFRVGGSVEVRADVRVVAATNRDLAKAIASGAFRDDLLYRLQVLEIDVPPLRERPQDAAPIAEHLLKRLAARDGSAPPPLTQAAAEKLAAYAWPGNVRELRNVLERALILRDWSDAGGGDGEGARAIDAADLVLGRARAGGGGPAAPADPLRPLKELEKEHIRSVLEALDWNKTRAAEVLGIGRTNIYEKIREYGLEPP